MRLNCIKLVGFKSFVDSTQLVLQSNLTAIVGPNGCGKSNIIDAIHCVLGSTSKNIRAEFLADLVFNGTITRKPAGRAAVELVFDNSEGQIPGEWGKYQEIAIRREISRDGQSIYFFNGMRCRRKDITDCFLGTGLGHAIIEQGMITRLIEAKPEELRLYVEEAAGISKYKERRRETENRIKQAKENLNRLNDLREEQFKQLVHLQKQADAAEKYKRLKADQRLVRAELQVIGWRELNEKILADEQKIQAKEVELESKVITLKNINQEVEHKKAARLKQADAVEELQRLYYALGSEITRVEQQVLHTQEREKQLQTDCKQLESSYQELKQQQFEDQERIDALSQESINVDALLAEAKIKSDDFQDKLVAFEEKIHCWQKEWDTFNQISAQTLKDNEVEKTKISHLEQRESFLSRRIKQIKEEEASYNLDEWIQEIIILREEQKKCTFQIEALQEQVELNQEKSRLEREGYQEVQQHIAMLVNRLRDLQAQHASMQALQQIALGKDNPKKKKWLAENGLSKLPQLAENLEVEPGWEVAVETVLASYLDAICIDDFNSLSDSIKERINVDLSFFNIKMKKNGKKTTDGILLSDKVNSIFPIGNLLNSIRVAENLAQALDLIETLPDSESVVTRDGIWLSQAWLRVSRLKKEETGILQREHDLRLLNKEIKVHQASLTKQELLLKEMESRLHQLTAERETTQHCLQTLKAKNSDFLAQIKAKETFIQQVKDRQAILIREASENEQALSEVGELLQIARNLVLLLDQKVKADHLKREALSSDHHQITGQLNEIRQQAILHKQKANEFQVRLEGMRSQIHHLNQNIARIVKQLKVVGEKREMLVQSLEGIDVPLVELNGQLQASLKKRADIQKSLSEAKQVLNTLEANLQILEKNRQRVEGECQAIRAELEQMRIGRQAFFVKKVAHEEQINAAGFSLQELNTRLMPDACAKMTEEHLQKITRQIQRLGPINLAAIDEFAVLSERKEYFDKQQADLTEALKMLEDAIRKIDRETRLKFKETFEKLAHLFTLYFMQIFEGGEATLKLTSDDLLETGVAVKAQPPGKKNTTIHLLSGGEKALTAIALMFAIFNLNPAPFCVLDEVDAPLDDVNVGRFCNLVRKMSEKVQFIFISHNKITIEMGKQLVGVTMHEPGVSRLVSVDIEQAISMAAT
jgi:chromosome segregation protein